MKFSSYLLHLFFKLIFALSILTYVSNLKAIETFIIKDIVIEGIRRTEPGTVFSYLPVSVGDSFDDKKASMSIKALYSTGFFKDVRIEVKDEVLIIIVQERPSIASIDFNGVKEFDSKQLKDSLKILGISKGQILDRSIIDRAEQELKRKYLSSGRYGMKITTTLTPLERNRIGITFSVDEGELSKIKNINIIGNQVFSEKKLLDQISLSTSGWFSWYTKSDQYSKQKLSGDLEKLRSYYLNRGFLEVQIESAQVSISPKKRDIYITINLKEGNKFVVNKINLEGQMFGKVDEFRSLITLEEGDPYSGEKMTNSLSKISEKMGVFGYAFADVRANPIIDREKNQVSFQIFINPGKRVYVRKINITGNDRTRDEVIRREFRQFESSWYDGSKIKLSRERVGRLGFFLETDIDTVMIPGKPDIVDLNVKVSEKPTGNIMVGAGFSSREKLVLSGSINQRNVFGTGNNVGININTSRIYRTIVLSHTNPYFNQDGVSRTFDVFLRTARPPLYLANIDYRVQTKGANIRFGLPFTEIDKIFFGLGIEDTEVRTFSNSPLRYKQYVEDFSDNSSQVGSAKSTAVPLIVAWQRDNRDSALIPTKGRLRRANFEISPAGSSSYYRATYQEQFFTSLPIFKSAILALNTKLNYGAGLGDKPYPIFKNYYAGGIGTVRGYYAGSLSVSGTGTPIRRTRYNLPIGGQARLVFNAELQMPFPGSGIDKSFRWFTFFDAGQVFNPQDGENIKFADMRFSTGVGVSWISPVGPLKLSMGYPINPKPFDRTQRFQFQLGTGF